LKNALLGASLVLLYGWQWMLATLIILLVLKAAAYAHDLLDCLSWVDNDNYAGTEEGEYY
jgi:hypothetical protein